MAQQTRFIFRAPFALLICLQLGACSSVSRVSERELDEAGRDFQSLSIEMTESEVVHRLGQPDFRRGRTATWKARMDWTNYDVARIWFADSGAIKRINRKHSRRSGADFEKTTVDLYSEDYAAWERDT